MLVENVHFFGIYGLKFGHLLLLVVFIFYWLLLHWIRGQVGA